MSLQTREVRSKEDLIKDGIGKLISVSVNGIKNCDLMPCEGIVNGQYSFISQCRTDRRKILSWRSKLRYLLFGGEGILFDTNHRSIAIYSEGEERYYSARQLLIDAKQWKEAPRIIEIKGRKSIDVCGRSIEVPA